MHSDISQSSPCSSSRLTLLELLLFEVKLQFVKVPFPLSSMETAPPCKQVDRTTQPHTHTHTQTAVSPCIARTTQHGIRTCTHDITMARTQWNGMNLHAYRLPTTTLQKDIHTHMRACIEMTTSSHTLNVLMSIFGGGGDIDHRVGTAASLLLRVDS